MPWKLIIFTFKCSKNDVFEGNYLKFVIYILWRLFEDTYSVFWTFWNFWGFFFLHKWKIILKKFPDFPIFLYFKNPREQLDSPLFCKCIITSCFYRLKWVRDSDTRKPLFLTRNRRPWRHSDVTHGRVIIDVKFFVRQHAQHWVRNGFWKFRNPIPFRCWSMPGNRPPRNPQKTETPSRTRVKGQIKFT